MLNVGKIFVCLMYHLTVYFQALQNLTIQVTHCMLYYLVEELSRDPYTRKMQPHNLYMISLPVPNRA